jgi:hypothetical protein
MEYLAYPILYNLFINKELFSVRKNLKINLIDYKVPNKSTGDS